MKKVCNAAIMLLLFISTGYSQSSDKKMMDEIFNNVSHDYVTCACYFTIVSWTLENSGNFGTAKQYMKARGIAVDYAIQAAGTSRSPEMAQDVTLARINMGMKQMTTEIDQNYSNISLLSAKYGDFCTRAMKEPDSVMKKWMEITLEKNPGN